MSEKKLAYDFWNTPEGIRSQKIFDMRDRIRRLEASNEELLELLEFCCYRTTPGADCWCQHGQGLVKLGHCSEESYCPVWQSIQKARGQEDE